MEGVGCYSAGGVLWGLVGSSVDLAAMQDSRGVLCASAPDFFSPFFWVG